MPHMQGCVVFRHLFIYLLIYLFIYRLFSIFLNTSIVVGADAVCVHLHLCSAVDKPLALSTVNIKKGGLRLSNAN